MRRAVWAAVLAGAASVPGAALVAHAAELIAEGPRECADAGEIAFRVERSIGMPLSQAAPLRFEVIMERASSGHVARIGVHGGPPGGAAMQRELVATDCGKLVDAVTVAVALALGAVDPDGADEGDEGDANGAAQGPQNDARAHPAAAQNADATAPLPKPAGNAGNDARDGVGDGVGPARNDAAWFPSLSLWLVGDAGSLPTTGVGAALGAEVGWGKFQLRAVGTLLFEQQTRLAPTPVAEAPGAKLELFTGGLLGCTAPFASLRAPLAPLLCLGAELGRLGGVGTGVTAPRRGSALWVAPLVQVGGFWAIPGTSLRLGLTLAAAVPLKRDAFTLRDVGTVYQPPSVVGRIAGGLDLGFD